MNEALSSNSKVDTELTIIWCYYEEFELALLNELMTECYDHTI